MPLPVTSIVGLGDAGKRPPARAPPLTARSILAASLHSFRRELNSARSVTPRHECKGAYEDSDARNGGDDGNSDGDGDDDGDVDDDDSDNEDEDGGANDNGKAPLRLRHSIYPLLPPTIAFEYVAAAGVKRCEVDERNMQEYREQTSATSASAVIASSNARALCFIADDVSVYNAVVGTLERNGIDISRDSSVSSDCALIWSRPMSERSMKKSVKATVNHFPTAQLLGRKDALIRTINAFRRSHPSLYTFMPESFMLPADRALFESSRCHSPPQRLYIVKPVNSSCGRGIRIITANKHIPKLKRCVVSSYIHNPLLIHKKKFDLRIYVLVTSMLPMRIYMFNNGLCRFCTEDYSSDITQLSDKFRHLTNYSINKNNTEFRPNNAAGDADDGDLGCESSSKWSIKTLANYMTRTYGAAVWSDCQNQIEDIVVRTIIAVEAPTVSAVIRSASTAFELYGLDVLIDDTFKCSLLEVNVMPSLSSSSPFDRFIKQQLMTDVFNCVGIRPTVNTAATTSPEKSPSSGSRHRLSDLTCCKDMNDYPYSADDLRVLRTTFDENLRRGNFKRLFPEPRMFSRLCDALDHVSGRYENKLIQRFMLELSAKRQHNILSGKLPPRSSAKPSMKSATTTSRRPSVSLSMSSVRSSVARTSSAPSRSPSQLPTPSPTPSVTLRTLNPQVFTPSSLMPTCVIPQTFAFPLRVPFINSKSAADWNAELARAHRRSLSLRI